MASLDESAWKQVRAILGSHDPLEINYGPLNSFLPYPCIWYEIQPVKKVLELRNALRETDYFNLEIRHPKNFIPHMTITEGLSGPTVDEELLAQLQGESKPGMFHCDSLAYIAQTNNSDFTSRRSYPWGSRDQSPGHGRVKYRSATRKKY